jgi:hypothetical protein
MRNLFILFFLFIFSLANNIVAQVKFEKESRIKSVDVPTRALNYIDTLDIDDKVIWYLEEGVNDKSVEAKFVHNKLKYSIEFDTLGNLQDIEVEIEWNIIEAAIKDAILAQLNQDCSKFKISKIQKQYTGNEKETLSIFGNKQNGGALEVKYEVMVKCHQESDVNLYEYLFDNQGRRLSNSRVTFRNSSHLEY